MRPSIVLFHGTGAVSWIGSASMSVLSNTHGSPPVPISATRPVPPAPDTKPLAASSSRFVFTAQPAV